MSLIKDVCVQHQASLCCKVRFQGWRCHLVNLGDFNTHPLHAHPTPYSPPPQKRKRQSCAVWLGCHLYPLSCAQGALWWHSLAVPVSSVLAHPSGHLLCRGAWPSGASINAHLASSIFLCHPTSPQSRKQELARRTPTRIRSFSPFLSRIRHLDKSLFPAAQNLSCGIIFTPFTHSVV